MEVHSFFDNNCARTSGIIVHVQNDSVALVELDGGVVTLSRQSINAIAIHKTLENPLPKIEVAPVLKQQLRDVWVGSDAQKTFTGWSIGFFDELYIYFDVSGQTHVLDPEEITRIAPATLDAAQVIPRSHAFAKLAFPQEVVPCGSLQNSGGAIFPSQVIADRIKVGEYLDKLEQRYREQKGFEERTKVYAGPFLFDQQSRLGLIYDSQTTLPFPLYFRWSGGRPYRFQSLSVVGNSPHEWLPVATPTLSLRSDAKSHFFHASFVGHILGLPAGTNPFKLMDVANSEPGDSSRQKTPVRVEHSYNYLLLMGVDWWRLSVSAGTSYLNVRLTAKGSEQRTILATSASPTVRLRYQGPNVSLRALYFRTRSQGKVIDTLGDVPDDFLGDTSGVVPKYSWRLDTARLGATWKISADMELLIDQIGSYGEYRDEMPATPVAFHFSEFTTAGELAINFGRYVTVRGNTRLQIQRLDVSKPKPKINPTSNVDLRFGGALEFLF